MAIAIQKNLGMLVLAIWLILTGVSAFVALGLPATLTAVLAIVAGVLILIGR